MFFTFDKLYIIQAIICSSKIMNKIKKFTDFMSGVGSNIRRSMNHLIVEGKTRSWFLADYKNFELHIYYTPLRGTIVDFKFYSEDGLTLDLIKPEFKLGDNIDVAKKWIEKKNYKVITDFSRL